MTTIANQIPITLGGLAIGERLSAYLCHMMDPVPATSDYSSVVFLQRLVSVAALAPGLFFLPALEKYHRRPNRRGCLAY